MRRTRKDWRRSVLRDPELADSTRVLLVHIADEHMRADRKFSVPRRQLADELNRHERRITERISDAHKRGYLVTVSPGFLGHTAEYQGTWPDWVCETDSRPHECETETSPHERETDSRPHSPRNQWVMRDGFPPTTTRASSSVVGHDRDVCNNDEQRQAA